MKDDGGKEENEVEGVGEFKRVGEDSKDPKEVKRPDEPPKNSKEIAQLNELVKAWHSAGNGQQEIYLKLQHAVSTLPITQYPNFWYEILLAIFPIQNSYGYSNQTINSLVELLRCFKPHDFDLAFNDDQCHFLMKRLTALFGWGVENCGEAYSQVYPLITHLLSLMHPARALSLILKFRMKKEKASNRSYHDYDYDDDVDDLYNRLTGRIREKVEELIREQQQRVKPSSSLAQVNDLIATWQPAKTLRYRDFWLLYLSGLKNRPISATSQINYTLLRICHDIVKNPLCKSGEQRLQLMDRNLQPSASDSKVSNPNEGNYQPPASMLPSDETTHLMLITWDDYWRVHEVANENIFSAELNSTDSFQPLLEILDFIWVQSQPNASDYSQLATIKERRRQQCLQLLLKATHSPVETTSAACQALQITRDLTSSFTSVATLVEAQDEKKSDNQESAPLDLEKLRSAIQQAQQAKTLTTKTSLHTAVSSAASTDAANEKQSDRQSKGDDYLLTALVAPLTGLNFSREINSQNSAATLVTTDSAPSSETKGDRKTSDIDATDFATLQKLNPNEIAMIEDRGYWLQICLKALTSSTDQETINYASYWLIVLSGSIFYGPSMRVQEKALTFDDKAKTLANLGEHKTSVLLPESQREPFLLYCWALIHQHDFEWGFVQKNSSAFTFVSKIITGIHTKAKEKLVSMSGYDSFPLIEQLPFAQRIQQCDSILTHWSHNQASKVSQVPSYDRGETKLNQLIEAANTYKTELKNSLTLIRRSQNEWDCGIFALSETSYQFRKNIYDRICQLSFYQHDHKSSADISLQEIDAAIHLYENLREAELLAGTERFSDKGFRENFYQIVEAFFAMREQYIHLYGGNTYEYHLEQHLLKVMQLKDQLTLIVGKIQIVEEKKGIMASIFETRNGGFVKMSQAKYDVRVAILAELLAQDFFKPKEAKEGADFSEVSLENINKVIETCQRIFNNNQLNPEEDFSVCLGSILRELHTIKGKYSELHGSREAKGSAAKYQIRHMPAATSFGAR